MGGSYNGLISFYDLRKSGARPHETSVIESSHHDPVYDVYWIKSKTGNLCASVSTDGQMLWWDTRRLGEPTEVLQLNTKSDGGSGGGQVLGGSSLAYNTEVRAAASPRAVLCLPSRHPPRRRETQRRPAPPSTWWARSRAWCCR